MVVGVKGVRLGGRVLAPLTISLMVLVVLVALSLSASAATPTGATGLISIPTADTLGTQDAEFTAHLSGGRFLGAITYSPLDQIEVGVNTAAKGVNSLELGFLIKAKLLAETAEAPAIALGFETGQSYVVASKRLSPRVRAHLGLGQGRISGLFAGAAISLSNASVQGRGGLPPMTVMGEYTPAGFHAGLRMVLTPQISFDLSLHRLKEVAGGITIRTRF